MPADTFQHRAIREAANALAEADLNLTATARDLVLSVVAVAWLRGYGAGSEDTLATAETAMRHLADDITAATAR